VEVKMNNKRFTSIKALLNDSNLIRDIRTVLALLLAYGLAVISNGLIEEFNPNSLVSVAVGIGAIGTYISIRIVTNEFTERGAFDENESNTELQELIKKQNELSKQLNTTKAYDYLDKYNKEQHKQLRKEKHNELKVKYEEQIKRIELLIKNAKLRNTRWFNFITKRQIRILNRRLKSNKKRLQNLSPTIYVKYEPLELDHLRTHGMLKNDENQSQAKRFKQNPQKKVRQRMATTNFVKTFFFISFQGAVIAQVTSWVEFIIFLGMMTLTLLFTAIGSYVYTRKEARENYVNVLRDKNDMLIYLIKMQNQNKSGS